MMVDLQPDRGIDAILQLIGERAGLSFRSAQQSTVIAEINRGMERAGFTNLDAYCQQLEYDVALLDDLLIELTVGETYFFRDPWHFDYIRDEILPGLQSERSNNFTFRAWSAGCASGEEAYSLAILLDKKGILPRSRVLGTDISRRALQRAREASYRRWSLRGPRIDQVMPYLEEQSNRLVLSERIRSGVQFEYLNLALDSYPSIATRTRDMDLIFCRNVMIYFDRPTVEAVAGRLYRALAPGGILITAASDPLLDEFADFDTIVTENGLIFRRPLETESPNRMRHLLPPKPVPLPTETLSSEGMEPATQDASATAASSLDQPGTNLPTRETESIEASIAGAVERGEYRRAVEIAAPHQDDPRICYLGVLALANVDTERAEADCRQLAHRHRFSAELFHLHAILLIELERLSEAVASARKVVYIDSRLAMGHYTLGSVLRRVGDTRGAQSAFRNAAELCRECPPDELVRLADGESADELRASAERQLVALQSQRGGKS